MNTVRWFRVSSMLMLALGLAMPAVAQILNNSETPGSVLVFPKFIRGTVPLNGATVPRTEIEISVRCPAEPGPAFGGALGCAEFLRIKLKAHWVCPGSQRFEEKFICRETDFNLFTTVNGTISINPESIVPRSANVPAPPCDRGYLVVWVVGVSTGATFQDQPLSFNGLIGNAVLRETGGASAYNAVPIQALQATGLPTALDPVTGGLVFSGLVPQYAALSERVNGTIRFDRVAGSPPLAVTALTLLTLDVRSNRPNNPTFVDLNFYNEAEALFSTSTEFVCWTQVPLSSISSSLNEAFMGSRKGLVLSDFAQKVAFIGTSDPVVGPVPILGIVETIEFDGREREYSYSLFNDNLRIPPLVQPQFTPSAARLP